MTELHVHEQAPGHGPETGIDAELLARIHRLSAEGASVHTIAAALNAEGLLTATGRRWHRNSVTRVLWQQQDIAVRAQREGQRRTAALTTVLTGRAELLARAEAMMSEVAQGTCLAMLVMDVDDFRHVNSAFGHLCGDAVLSQMSDRLQDVAAVDDVVARVGGDAFAMLTTVPGRDVEAIQQAVGALVSVMRVPYRTSTGADVAVSMTIGVACEAVSAAELLRNAELAMYRAKEAHSSWAVYRPDLDEPAAAGLVQAAELRAALAAGEVTVHYQPIVDLRTGLAHSVEALARWQHPERGLLLPSEFLPVAERFDLMSELTEVVITRVTAQIRAWAEEGRSLPCAINLTATCLTDPRCGRRLVDALSGLGGSVTVEVVESVMADARAIRVLEQLAKAGVTCAIDDFGTGYSSLGSLKALPATQLKLDRLLLRDVDSDPRVLEVVRAVVRLAGAFNLGVITEGVETEEMAVQLREAGVFLAQGNWFGRPMPATELAAWLAAPPRPVPLRVGPQPDSGRDHFEHSVMLHGGGDDELMDEVAAFLTASLVADGDAIAVVTPEHRDALLAALPHAARQRAELQDRLLVLDARQTLALFMVDGSPDPQLFHTRVAGPLLERLSRSSGLRAYGDMTTLLWQDGNVVGALALEELWNDVGREAPFVLLCAYPVPDVQDDEAAVGRLCHGHTAVVLGGARDRSA